MEANFKFTFYKCFILLKLFKRLCHYFCTVVVFLIDNDDDDGDGGFSRIISHNLGSKSYKASHLILTYFRIWASKGRGSNNN